jgi:hypothetical protein
MSSAKWLLLLTPHPDFPDPTKEVRRLSQVDQQTAGAYLKLLNPPHPPLSRATTGDLIYLCTHAPGTSSLSFLGRVRVRGGAQEEH